MIIKQPIVEKCQGCGKITTDHVALICSVYVIPASKWRIGNCPTATHVEKEKIENKFIDPLKASKKSMKKKK